MSQSEGFIRCAEAGTLSGLLVERLRRSPHGEAYRAYDKGNKAWYSLSWSQFSQQVARWQAALSKLGLKAGDRVALSLHNGPQWACFDQAALGLGLVVVPLYTDDRAENVAYILEQTASKLLLLHDEARWRRIAHALAEHDQLQHIVLLDGGPQEGDNRLIAAPRLLPEGKYELQCVPQQPHALASIIYTSGTTGRPKGVMLSHHNILSIADAALQLVQIDSNDTFLSFLPLSHTLERTAGYYLPMMAGATVAYARSIPQLASDLLTIQPTVLISVPRIYERIHGKLSQQLQQSSALKRALFNAAVNVGWHQFEFQQGRCAWHPKLLLHPLLQQLVANKLQQRLGGRLRFAISGGAPLPPEIARLFIGLGITLLQGYGLTETSPVISVNTPQNNLPSSVGPPMPGIEVRIGPDQELQARGPGVMLGYWNNPQATAAVIDDEGWLGTGDQAHIEKSGHITITGRLKDILVLSNGEKVAPGEMEIAITLNPLFEQVMIIGEARPYLAALLVLNQELWPKLAAECGVAPDSPHALQDKGVLKRVQKLVSEQLSGFPGYVKVRRVYLTLETWNVDNGLLTPTLKVKRPRVMAHLNEEIERLYRDGDGQA